MLISPSDPAFMHIALHKRKNDGALNDLCRLMINDPPGPRLSLECA
jgi:hypothetical protein